ncbi:MAG: hypothetical protein GX177_03580 [Firmicutes bacterium]|jgi:hypothetical protein|nr:hypothetical protein [Bacillota bacterium]
MSSFRFSSSPLFSFTAGNSYLGIVPLSSAHSYNKVAITIGTGGKELNGEEEAAVGKNNKCQTHVHEFLGTTKIAGHPLHNHRFAGVSGQEIPIPNGHIHAIDVNSDFTIGHLHEISILTGPQIPVGGGRHVHFAMGISTENRGHVHEFIVATMIENPDGY